MFQPLKYLVARKKSVRTILGVLLAAVCISTYLSPTVFALDSRASQIAVCVEQDKLSEADCAKKVDAALAAANPPIAPSVADAASAGPSASTTPSSESGGSGNEFLGSGFEEITRYSNQASNAMVKTRGGTFAEGGVGTLNALLYNAKDYIKFIAGSLAVLWLVISAIRLVVASDEEGIKGARKGMQWSIIGLVAIFIVDIFVIALFEGGTSTGGETPGGSIVQVVQEGGDRLGANSVVIDDNGRKIGINLDVTARRDFMRNITLYFVRDVRLIFEWIKVIGGALAVLMIFFTGVMMVINSGNDEKVEDSKKYLMHILTAFVTLLMLDTLIFKGLYPDALVVVKGPNGQTIEAYLNEPECVEFMKTVDQDNLSVIPTLPGTSTPALSGGSPLTKERCLKSASMIGRTVSEQSVLGTVRFFESIIGGIAVFFLVYSGIRIIGSFGNEEVVTKHKKQIFWSLGGLLLILIADNAVRHFFFITNYETGNVSMNIKQGFTDIAGITNFIASFVGVFSFVSLIVSGMMWVVNFGNEELAGKAKKIIAYAAVGVLLSVSAYALVQTLTSGKSVTRDGIQVKADVKR